MATRCPTCGYSNDPEFRFCGMCGAPLNRQYDEANRHDEPIRPKPPPPPKDTGAVNASAGSALAPSALQRSFTGERSVPGTANTAKKEYSPVSGPSFLGLDPAAAAEPAPQYLLEDDEPSGHGRLFVGVLLLLAVGGGLFWQWQHEGYPWNPPPKQAVSSTSGDAAEAPVPPASDATPSSSSPAEAAGPSDKSAPPPAADKAEPKPAADKAEPKPDEKSDEADSSPAPAQPEDRPAPKPTKVMAAPPPITKARRQVREVASPPPADDPDPSEALFVDGQKFLYGSGVPEDCGRARSKLMAAANQSNAKAQSTVATMYATGHCLPRNLPSAYHWFALALHNDRDNTRLQRDLEMIWGQMSAEEKQIALKSR